MWRKLRRFLGFMMAGLLVLAIVVMVLGWLSTARFAAFGGRPDPDRLRMSEHFVEGRFQNLEPTSLMAASRWFWALREWLVGGQMRAPICPLPMATDSVARWRVPPVSGLRVTWLGHSTTLIEVDGATVLTDPMWGERASPSSWVGPRRFHPPPVPLDSLPHLDAVVVSHEHYDHLDCGTVKALAAHGTVFHVPLGIGAHLAAWQVPATQIAEHDWWQEARLPHDVRLIATPARHFNGRLPGRTGAFWTSWSIVGPRHRVFFSGDTGLTESAREVGRRFGPFDVALLEIGQWNEAWGDIHLGPVGALNTFARLDAKVLIPIHWGTFVLAYHAWSEPAETLVTEAARRRAPVLTPRLGEPVEPNIANVPNVPNVPTWTPWWRAYPPLAPRCP